MKSLCHAFPCLPILLLIFSCRSRVVLIDSDGDGLSDLHEEVVGSDPNDEDSNDDGVLDGVELVTGVSPAHTAFTSVGDKPEIHFPFPGIEIPIKTGASQRPLIPIIISPIPGGTTYQVTMTGFASTIQDRFDFQSGDLVIAPHRALVAMSLDGIVDEGLYSLVISAAHGSSAMGKTSDALEISFAGTTPTSFFPNNDITFIGDTHILATDVVIPEQVSVSIADGTLFIWSMGNITVNGELIGVDGITNGEVGASIVLSAVDSIIVNGNIKAGRGASGSSTEFVGSDNASLRVSGELGGEGGSVTLISKSRVEFSASSTVTAGNGGPGGALLAFGGNGVIDGLNPLGNAPSVFAEGANGGRGGDLQIFAIESVYCASAGVLSSGDGGSGGSVSVFGGDGANPTGLGGFATGMSAVGGESGDLYLSHIQPFLLQGSSEGIGPIGGGRGGLVGDLLVQSGNTATTKASKVPILFQGQEEHSCPCPTSQDGEDHTPPRGQKGLPGWLEPSGGGNARAEGKNAVGCGKGGNAVAEGGPGGEVKSLAIGADWIPLISITPGNPWQHTVGGRGGNAIAIGGKGGFDGGRGGTATAKGGDGGKAPEAFIGIVFVRGGRGGNANAYGGDGSDAPACCAPPGAALKGGDGGSANATGGNGGDGQSGGNGGNAYAKAGSGKRGGDGRPPGSGGIAGTSAVVKGVRGSGIVAAGPGLGADGLDGSETPVNGSNGTSGNPCP